MNVQIDSSRCAGHGSCVIICSSVFDLDDDGFGRVVEPNPDESLRSNVVDAAENCPEQAISVTG
ncbi:MAG TPA: ferredoxin [Jatrophihabitantaceae bacterium]|jgi:ferredoxin|nr:ferredoxin [Jatrophihabitantaceae bacterium]